MTLSEAFRKGSQILKNSDIDTPATDAGVLLCTITKCSREHLYAHGDDELDEGLFQEYCTALEKRSMGYPLQYLTGMQEFMSLPFAVRPGVLIPRQDTELLVEIVLKFCRDKRDKSELNISGLCRILDMGAGSGCIAVSLANYLPLCTVTAVDKMDDALEIVRINARANGVEDRVIIVKSDLFNSVKMPLSNEERFDVIVSNPPYIRSKDICALQREVREHEPIEALDGGMDGLFFYREIINAAPAYLKDGGMLAFETGFDQAEDVAELMSCCKDDIAGIENVISPGFTGISIYKDLAGIGRVVAGVLQNTTLSQEAPL